ncbi:MAG: restriction endonuclease [Luteimonas sp.]
MTTQWIAAIGVAVAIGFAASFYFLTFQRRRDETSAGIVALSAISWRGFIGMVLQALRNRGYVQVVDLEDVSGDRDYMLERNGGRWLLSCKHGATFVLGRNAVQALSSEVLLKSAAGGLLVTQGRIDGEARSAAGKQRIELLDGQTLWPELRDLLPAGELDAIRAKTGLDARRRSLLGWLFALLAGVATFLAMPAPAAPAAAAAASNANTGSGATAPATVRIEAPPHAPIETQRSDLTRALLTLPDVERAVWATSSTLQVFVSRIDDQTIVDAVCAQVLRQPDLTSSRLMLTPPADSGQSARFLQCRSF